MLQIDKLIVKPLTYEELPYLKEVRDQSLDYLETQISYTLNQTQQWFKSNSPEWYSIYLDSQFIGYIRTSDSNKVSNSIYIGMDLAPAYRGNGYAYDIYKTFFMWLKNHGYMHVLLRVQVRNYRAYNLYRKLGFSPVGILENFITLSPSKCLDVILMQKKL